MVFERMPLEIWFDEYQFEVDYDIGESGMKFLSVKDLGIDLNEVELRYGYHLGHPELREEISKQYNGMSLNNVAVTTGASEGNFAVIGHLVGSKDHMIIEHPTYPSFLSPLEYLSRMSKLYEIQRDPEELLEFVSLLPAKDRQIGNLSAGMYQRLGIAQSLMGYPKLVFLDEPTSNLDVTGRSEVLELIMRLHKDTGTSFVISSHILSELQTICSDVAFLGNGVVLEGGSMMDIMKRHSSDRIRIITSDATQLAHFLEKTSWSERVRIAGASTVTLSSSLELDNVRMKITEIIKNQPLIIL